MFDLTSPEAALVGTAAILAAGLIGWFGRGFAFLLTRWWTKSTKQERATFLKTVAELGAKLRESGMTIEDVQALERIVQNPSVASSEAATRVVGQLADDTREPEAFQSNYAMKSRTGAALCVSDAKLHQALRDLELLASENEWAAIQKAQEHWLAYRDAMSTAAALQWEGGTHAGLAAGLALVAETDRRADEIRAQVQERADR